MVAKTKNETKKRKMTKFDTIALDIAEGIANTPIAWKEAFTELLKALENKHGALIDKKRLSTKNRTKLASRARRGRRKK